MRAWGERRCFGGLRLWEEPVERFLRGGLGTLPLAALTDEAGGHLAEVVARIEARLDQEADPALAERLRAGTFLLLGLRYEMDQIPESLKRSRIVEESSTYQYVLRRGEMAGVRHSLPRMGANKFGVPADAATAARIESITDLDRLDALTDRVPLVSTWADLLAEV